MRLISEYVQLAIGGIEYNVEPKVTPKDCWQTPQFILRLVREVFREGIIYTDPCTVGYNPTNAVNFYTPSENGLRRQWEKNAWVNPPYSDPSLWLGEIHRQIKVGNIKEAIALVPTGCLGTERSCPAAQTANALCFWRGRIHFINPATEKQQKQTSFTSAFVYWGDRSSTFLEVFKEHGICSIIV